MSKKEMTQKEINQNSIAYNRNRYDQIKIQSDKKMKLRELIARGATMRNMSSAKYIEGAIIDRLHNDGLVIPTIDIDNSKTGD